MTPLYIVLILMSSTGQEIAREHYATPVFSDARSCLFQGNIMAGAKITTTCVNRRPDRPCIPQVDHEVWIASCTTEEPQ